MNKIFAYCLFALLFLSPQAMAIDYQLPDLNDQVQSLDKYKGKWIVVNYWATWCGTCIKELPDLISLHEDNKEGDIVVVGINFERINLDRLKNFVTKQSIPYTVLRTEPARETPLGIVPALPTTYIIDPDGKIIAGQAGLVTKKDLEDFIQGKKVADDNV